LPAPAWLTGWPDQKPVRVCWRVTRHRYAAWCPFQADAVR